MKSEADVKRAMVKEINRAGGYARRIEDQYAVGILDTVLIPPRGITFFCEVKLIRGQSFGPTPRQWEEMRRVEEAGARDAFALLVGYKDKKHYFATFGMIPERGGKIQASACFEQRDGCTFLQSLEEFYRSHYE